MILEVFAWPWQAGAPWRTFYETWDSFHIRHLKSNHFFSCKRNILLQTICYLVMYKLWINNSRFFFASPAINKCSTCQNGSHFSFENSKFCTIGRVWGRSFLADARECYYCTQIIRQTQTCLWETSACFMRTLSFWCTFTPVSHHMVHMCAYKTPEGQFMWTSLICSFSQLKHWQAMISLLQNNRISQIKNYIWLVYS